MEEKEIAQICGVLSEEKRVKILRLLQNGELCACKLLEKFELTQPTLSHHMKTLVEVGLVTTRKFGKWSYYSINQEKLDSFKEVICSFSANPKCEEGKCQ